MTTCPAADKTPDSVTLPIILDVEASGFGAGSYPIEVGYYVPGDGTTVPPAGRSYCTLIRPPPEWTHWDPEAEKVHNISREILLAKGRPAVDVCLDLNEALRGRAVFCDAWLHDSVWLAKLFDAVDCVQLFRLRDLRELLAECEQTLWHDVRSEVEERLALRRHRASGDARILSETLTEARKRCAPDW